MRRPETVTLDKGPRVALELMRERGISNLFVIGRGKRLLGVITAEDASRAAKSGIGLEEILITDAPRVAPDTVLSDLFEVTSSSKVPLAVVDEQDRLLGVIVRGAVLGALAGEHHELKEEVRPDGIHPEIAASRVD